MEAIAINVKRLRTLKKLSQKEIALSIDIPQGQYSRIESGKVIPSIPTLKKIAEVFDVHLTEFVKECEEEPVNMTLMEKIKMIQLLEEDEQNALFKIIDVAISRKQLKDSLNNLITS